jgi:GxxExxY protein
MAMELNAITGQIVDAAIKVHRSVGPGLLESAYEGCLVYELRQRGLELKAQVALPVRYEGILIDAGYRIDLLVQDQVIVELKAVEHLLPIHEAQILSYLRLSGYKAGLLINFHVAQLKHGIRRFVY